MFKNPFKNIGPATLITAAFIGPGTVTVCTLAGVHFGYHLLWTMLLSVIATIVLQEMAARLGIVSQKGLSELIRIELKNPLTRLIVLFLVLSAIVIGNASYEAGNISGGILGLETITGDLKSTFYGLQINFSALIIGMLAFILLYIGTYRFLEFALIGLVLLMSLSFLITAIVTKPNLSELIYGLLIPSTPKGSLITILALIGTTVVPYNLFLHASLVKEKWKQKTDIKYATKDLVFSILLGGLVSISIIISAASVQSLEISNASDLAKSLMPMYGKWATYFLGMGLFAAGITSAITAPLAAAYVVKGCFGWEENMRGKKFRSVWIFILLLGVLFSCFGIKPIQIIQFAQVANGILLPVIVMILLWIVNKKSVLGRYVNSTTQNILGVIICMITIFLGVKGILKVFGV